MTLGASLVCEVCAQGRPGGSDEPRSALVIGNAAYKAGPLANPRNDASDVGRVLTGLGFDVTIRQDASKRQIEEEIRAFGARLRKGGIGLFFYAGHAVQNREGRNYLVPIDAEIGSEADLAYETVDVALLLDHMEQAQNRINIVLLDACRNNPFRGLFRSPARGLSAVQAASGTFVAYATQPGNVAEDGSGRNSPFTKNLILSLEHPDSDIHRVFSRVTAGVSEETARRQVPWVSHSLTGDFYFKGTPAAPAAAAPAVQMAALPPKTPAPSPAAVDALSGDLQRLAPGTTFRDCAVCPEMVVIPPGRFRMGSPFSEEGRRRDEGPQHPVTIARKFAVGKFEVTFDEWAACYREYGCKEEANDYNWGRGRRPAVGVSWEDAKAYTQWLSRKTGRRYRLLSEAEWEYVARAGTATPFSTGTSISPQQANYDAKGTYAGSVSGAQRPAPVGRFPPNAFGVHDMHGNVWEWVEDCPSENYLGAPEDGSAWTRDCDRRVGRGGAWNSTPENVRSASRMPMNAGAQMTDTGLRVARD